MSLPGSAVTASAPAKPLACVDVAYSPEQAAVGCVLFQDWTDATATLEVTRQCPAADAYRSGEFYRRELPCLMAVLDELQSHIRAVIVDGYVWLDADGTPGLGARLHAALGARIPVVGVAKTAFRGAPALEIRRGRSQRPLFVSAAGMPVDEAASGVSAMSGAFRIPTLLARADALGRAGLREGRDASRHPGSG